jgi:prophage maintenance system killer protein
VDGDTRLTWAGTRVFCLLHGLDLVFTVDTAETMIVAIAAGQLEVTELAEQLRAALTKADRPG